MFLWTPPPSVADLALEELLKSRHKRTDLFHVIVLPRLMAPRWRHLFLKVCDFTFVASPGLPFWPTDMFEPLWVGIILPFAHCRPWSLKRASLLVEMERDVCRVFETRCKEYTAETPSPPETACPLNTMCGMRRATHTMGRSSSRCQGSLMRRETPGTTRRHNVGR